MASTIIILASYGERLRFSIACLKRMAMPTVSFVVAPMLDLPSFIDAMACPASYSGYVHLVPPPQDRPCRPPPELALPRGVRDVVDLCEVPQRYPCAPVDVLVPCRAQPSRAACPLGVAPLRALCYTFSCS